MDLLTWPVLGPFLKWRHARTALQIPLFLVAALIIFDGLVGPRLAPKNLATVGVWLHYRGLVVLALLLAGNLFCMACPFMLPRQAARWLRERFGSGGRAVPRWLRGKWLAVGLVALFFFYYEAFDLWATPWWTAWIALGYFVVAFAVDAVFRGATFCKHVCPLGQFNFFGSLISPLEIKVREAAVCAGCRTKDCIKAGVEKRPGLEASAGLVVDANNRLKPLVQNSEGLSSRQIPMPGVPVTTVHENVAEHPERSTAVRSRRSGAVVRAGPHPSTGHYSLSVLDSRPAQDADGFSEQMDMPGAAPRRPKSDVAACCVPGPAPTSGFPGQLFMPGTAPRPMKKPNQVNLRPLFSEQGALRIKPGVRGCELALYQPRKVGNMDCTFCLDCIHACPYDNIGLITRTPTAELWTDPFRSGVGRFSGRTDLAALVVVFVFGAYLNAFAMIRPVYALQAALARGLGTASDLPGLALIFAIGLVILPVVLLLSAGLATRALAGSWEVSLLRVIRRYVYALAPMGFGMWLAHYGFHFLTGGLTIVPVAQSFLADVGLYAGTPGWGLGPLVPPDWLFPIEAVLLYLGAFGSIIVAFRIAVAQSAGLRHILAAAAPWMLLTLLLLGFGLWILLQPMEMRGTMQMLTGA